MKSYNELSKEIDINLDKLSQVIRKYSNIEIEERLKALEKSISALRSTYK